jgi:hypothetical protein
MKKTGKCREPEIEEPKFIVLDEYARVFAGCREGYPYYSDNMDEAKPLQGQAKFDFLRKYNHINLEQMFLEPNVGKKRRNRKTKVSI